MLKVEGLQKNYPSFSLKNVSFSLEKGYITGFIGMNGAGKTTTLKALMNIVKPDGGKVTFLGKDYFENEVELKQEIGFMLGPVDFYPKSSVKTLSSVYKRFYKDWDNALYEKYIKQFGIDEKKKICELSTGMKVKYGIALALSHNAKLIILDEPTSGLDPIARDELLDLFRELIEDGERSILFSTHITSDLDKCADFILFIRNGEIIADTTKDELIETHALIEGANEDLTDELKARCVSYKTNRYGFKGLILKSQLLDSDKVTVEVPNLEDIMVYYNKEHTL